MSTARERIRKALMFGHHPDHADLLVLWEEATGEKLEMGKRCERCDGEGKIELIQLPTWGKLTPVKNLPISHVPCPICMDGSGNGCGYTTKPTWLVDHELQLQRASR